MRTRGVTQNAFPHPVVAGTERSADVGVHLANVDSGIVEAPEYRRIALFEQGNQQVLGTDVIVAVVAALLFGDAQHAPRGWAKF